MFEFFELMDVSRIDMYVCFVVCFFEELFCVIKCFVVRFDVVMVTGPNSLRVVQLAVASRHPRKLTYLREFGKMWQQAC